MRVGTLSPAPVTVDEQCHSISLALHPRIAGAALAEVFGRQHDGARSGPPACHVLDARYVPGDSCIILYQLGERLVIGRLNWNGPGHETGFDQTPPAYHFTTFSANSDRSRRVAPLGMRAYLFPHDPALPALPALLEPPAMAHALTRALPECRRRNGRLLRCRVTPLRYRPGRRCTLRIELRLRDTRTGAITSRTLFGKVYHDAAKARSVYDEMQMLASAAPVQDGDIVLAHAVAFLPDLALLLQEPVGGMPLDMQFGRLRGAATTGSHCGWNNSLRVATALAALHRTEVATKRERLITAELARFRRRTARVALADPGLGERMDELVTALFAWFEQLPAWGAEVGLVHGDCKPSQFLAGPAHVALLDFDHCGMADPAADVGTFLASLRQLGVRQWLKERGSTAASARVLWLQALEQSFLGEYCAASGRGHDFQRRATWYEAVALQRKALRSFARSPRSPLPATLVNEAWNCLATLSTN